MRSSELLLLLLLQPALVSAQSRTIRGVVVDSGGKGVPFAVIALMSAQRLVEADENGRFRLQVDPVDSCTLGARRSGFHSTSIKLETCPDTAIRIVLVRAAREESGPRCGTRSTLLCSAPNAERFESVTAGQNHSCALTREGVAWCWGDGQTMALGNGWAALQRWPVRVGTDFRFERLAAGGSFTCGITTTGSLVCWGANVVVPNWPRPAPIPVEVARVGSEASLTAGRRHACVLDESGAASCWGWNVDGETGNGTSGIASSLVPSPTPVTGGHRFTSISAGFDFTCGATVGGQVFCWGSNVDKVLGDTAPERCGDAEPIPCSSRPVEVSMPEPVLEVASGTSQVCARSASAVFCWGGNGNGQLGVVGPTTHTPQRVPLPGEGQLSAVASGGIETCALTAGGDVYCWGADFRRTQATSLTQDDVTPRRVARGVRAVSMGQLHSCLVTSSGFVQCWGDTIMGAFGVR